FLLRPAPQHSATGAEEEAGQQAGSADDAAAGGEGTAGTGPGGTASAPPSGEVIVHVTGAVGHPSVVTLAAGARVQDAVEAAGGLKGDAAADSVNLARVLTDGEQIHIPEEGEDTGTDAQTPGGTAEAREPPPRAAGRGRGPPDSRARSIATPPTPPPCRHCRAWDRSPPRRSSATDRPSPSPPSTICCWSKASDRRPSKASKTLSASDEAGTGRRQPSSRENPRIPARCTAARDWAAAKARMWP